MEPQTCPWCGAAPTTAVNQCRVGVEFFMVEGQVKAGTIDLDVGVPVLVDQEVRLANVAQGPVDLDGEEVLRGEVEPAPLELRLAGRNSLR